MTSAPTLAFPPSKVLAGWWKHLAPHKPHNVRVADLALHRVEARVLARRPVPLDPVALFILKAAGVAPQSSPEQIAARLDLAPPFVRQVLQRLATDDLVGETAQGAWSLTQAGAGAVKDGIFTRLEPQRRPFYFVQSDRRPAVPEFVHIANETALRLASPHDAWRFDAGALYACLTKSLDWKRERGFPQDVEDVGGASAPADAARTPREHWQQIIVDQPRHVLAVLLTVAAQHTNEKLIAFSIQEERWLLDTQAPVFEVNGPWQEALPDLADEPAPDDWRQAWREWCRPRGLLIPEAEQCPLEPTGCKIRAFLSNRLVNKLRSIHSDALQGIAWLLAGTGSVRTAACLEIIEQK